MMGDRKEPNPPPARAVKPDPPSAPPDQDAGLADDHTEMTARAGGEVSERDLFRAVLRVQQDRELHPLTCANCSPPERDDFPLVPWVGERGAVELRCPLCGWRRQIMPRLRALILEGAKLAIENARTGGALAALRMLDGEGAEGWTFCADALPAEAGRYEVAYVLPGESVFGRRGRWDGKRWLNRGELTPLGIYAWRPIVEAPPPLRPADRAYLRAQGVPAEWLGEG